MARTLTGWCKGYEVYYSGKCWYWKDTNEPIVLTPRTCKQCGQPSTVEGYDPCIGKIDGAIGACCGHGVCTGYIQWEGTEYPYGWKRGIRLAADTK